MLNEEKIVKTVLLNFKRKQKQGIKAHSRHIQQKQGMKSEVRLYRWIELDKVMELKSEPFSSEQEAVHFAEVFQDCFLYDPTVVREKENYYVYTGWVLKMGFYSYGLNQQFQYYVFTNYS